MKTTSGPIITNNRNGGFFLTIKSNLNLTDGEAGFCYAEAAEAIADAHGLEREVVTRFLDEPIGRHIADTVRTKFDVTEAVQAAFANWGKSLHRALRKIQAEVDGPPASMRTLVRKLSPERAQEIRTAYYKAAEGLAALHRALKDVSAETAAQLWREELVNAAEAERSLGKSQLGAHL